MVSDSRRHGQPDYLSEPSMSPFGDLELRSRRTLQQLSFSSWRGASNLLTKARRALDDHDIARAEALVDRAVRLPFDEHERAAPAAMEVHMQLFGAVTDALEQSDQDDSRWLDAALDVLGAAIDTESAAAYDLRDVLADIDHDYELSRPEHRRIAAAIAPVPARAELRDLELTAPELHEHVMAVLAACRDYDRTLAAHRT